MQQIPEQIPADAITYVRTTGEPAIIRTDAAGNVDAIVWSPVPSSPWHEQLDAAPLDAPVPLDAVGLGDRISIVVSIPHMTTTATTTDRTADYITGWMLDAGYRVEHHRDPSSPHIALAEGALSLITPEGDVCYRCALSNAGNMRGRVAEIASYND